MRRTKQEKILILTVSIFLFLVVNLAADFIRQKYYFQGSIYAEKYSEEQIKFSKTHGNKVHPFYGLSSASISGFDSSLSSENNFMNVSPSKSEKSIKILVLGGSVAAHLSMKRPDNTKDYLFSRELNNYFNTDRFIVYNAAFGGGKQPQQYFKLLYLNLLGFTPDLVINYDGFNEIALPFAENLERDINAIYPRAFDQSILGSLYDGACFPLNNKLLSFNSYLPIFELPKWMYVRKCHNRVMGAQKKIIFHSHELFKEEKLNYLERVKLIWSKSSNMISQHLELKNIPYIHVLQPNQYFLGSKKLTKIELEKFYNYMPYKKPIESYYGMLSMQELNVKNKIDQRYLFKEEPRTVYSDNCCHFNKLGMKIIIRDIIERASPIFLKLLQNEKVD